MAADLSSLAPGGKGRQNPSNARGREMRIIGLVAAGLCLIGAAAFAQPKSAGAPDPILVQDLVLANRILSDLGVLDGFGHVSVRHDKSPDRYLMSRSMAPALVK